MRFVWSSSRLLKSLIAKDYLMRLRTWEQASEISNSHFFLQTGQVGQALTRSLAWLTNGFKWSTKRLGLASSYLVVLSFVRSRRGETKWKIKTNRKIDFYFIIHATPCHATLRSKYFYKKQQQEELMAIKQRERGAEWVFSTFWAGHSKMVIFFVVLGSRLTDSPTDHWLAS